MLVTNDRYRAIRDGKVRVLFRKWKQQNHVAGDTIGVRDLHLVVDAVGQVPASSLTDADAEAAGFADLGALLRTLEERGPGRDDPDRLVWRVDVHLADAGEAERPGA